MKKLALILGNQLFPPDEIIFTKDTEIFMCEDFGFFSDVKHHKSKIALILCAMRSYRDSLIKEGYKVTYINFESKFKESYVSKLEGHLVTNNIKKIISYEIEDKHIEKLFSMMSQKLNLDYEVLQTPMFLDSRQSFSEFSHNKEKLLHGNYYKRNRKKFNILLDNDQPIGGKWSYDEMNRLRLPKDYKIPELPLLIDHSDKDKIIKFVNSTFHDHPGHINLFTPYTNEQAKEWLDVFLKNRFLDFGPYEDAIVENQHFLLHSVLSSSLNLGLITPKYVIQRTLEFSKTNDIPINSTEGFIRQILGWREFIRGVYQNFSKQMIQRNFFNHKRKMKDSWYEGNTGIPPLDDAIDGAKKYGFTHHINRLMIISNLMNLSNIHPNEIHKWFMEMFIDSSEWVMVPNVYGMGTYADGGVFSTKPYICGSSYIIRMSNFKKGDWSNIVDGLYWKFIEDNSDFFSKNPRLSLMTRSLNKIKPERKELIYKSAKEFITKNTYV